ncbi:hypothetical protein BJ165DRAFT_295460 [Panaeolus papilionaceus]|nr:hypothetical protein BJ165DRAFT_295460 [Panaeolus papilionaceus]
MMETSGCPEPLEKIFQKVEEESARRAQEEAKERAREEAEQRLHSASTQNGNGVAPDSAEAYSKDRDAAQEADVDVQFANGADGDTKVAPIEDDDEPTALAGTMPRAKSRRRRGSVSISRIGILPIEDLISSKTQLSPSSPSHLTMAVRSPFYQAQMMNSSTTSIASGASAHSQSDAHTEDDNHVTQMHHIIPKPSIGSKIIDMPRRLSRAHSASVIPTTSSLGLGVTGGEGAPLVIGVVVQEQRVERECKRHWHWERECRRSECGRSGGGVVEEGERADDED